MNKIFLNSALTVASIIISLIIVEYAYRLMIFSDTEAFQEWRNPGLYADFYSEDLYWKLYYEWDGFYKPPTCVHPELGWINNFTRHSLLHWHMKYYQSKRPVLLYGDSYAMCSPKATTFEDILNVDSVFSKENYLFNYGVGGYGLDQIYLLFNKSFTHYEKPVVVFSLFVHDLDRTYLKVRTGQKPWFDFEDDSLVLHTDLDPNAAEYFDDHPPRAFSFVARKYLFSDQNVFSEKQTQRLLGLSEVIEKKKAINGYLLQQVVDQLRASKTDFVFLIFHILHWDKPNFGPSAENDWRNVFLKDFLTKNEVPYIWSKDLVLNDNSYDTSDISKYMIPGDGHPTTYFNTLIAAEIKKAVLSFPSNFDERISWDNARIEKIEMDSIPFIDKGYKNKTFWDYDFTYYKDYIFRLENGIRSDARLMGVAQDEAKKQNRPLDQIIRELALYLIWEIEADCIMTKDQTHNQN